MKNKKAWLAVLLNILFPGLAYLYLGTRKAFGLILVAMGILTWYAYATDAELRGLTEAMSGSTVLSITMILMVVAFAVDAYYETKRVNQGA